jgi:hypothetical protein
MRTRATVFVMVVSLALVFAASALAGGNAATKSVYNNAGTKVQAAVAKVTHPKSESAGNLAAKASPTVAQARTLPFTGADLGLIGGAAFVLLLLGVSVRHLARRSPTA